jgi:uracil-DNA glycosylase family 4
MNRNRDAAWRALNRRIETCAACERLVAHCRRLAEEKKRAYRDQEYWGRPVANFGDPGARLLIVGLAPGAHGSNRTGRMFTGDASGDWLFRALHRAGFATQPTSTRRDDGLRLIDCAITAVGHCAPPGNKPTPAELDNCRSWLEATLDLTPARVYMALGAIAWQGLSREAKRRGWLTGATPKFGHGTSVPLSEARWMLASYHPSRQNTNTGVLTEKMLDDAFRTAKELINGGRRARRRS